MEPPFAGRFILKSAGLFYFAWKKLLGKLSLNNNSKTADDKFSSIVTRFFLQILLAARLQCWTALVFLIEYKMSK